MIPYVVSQDIVLLLSRWAHERKFMLPSRQWIDGLRAEFADELSAMVEPLQIISEEVMQTQFQECIVQEQERCRAAAVVLDRVYIPQQPGQFRLDVTRVIHGDSVVRQQRVGSLPLDQQFLLLTTLCRYQGIHNVVLVDDVLFEGHTMGETIAALRREGITVRGVVVGVSTVLGRQYLEQMDVGVVSVFAYEHVQDQICERDFWVGIPYGGRSLSVDGGVQSVSYLWPQGKAEWASLPALAFPVFSRSQKLRSLRLFEEIERWSGRSVLVSDLDRRPHLASAVRERVVDMIQDDLEHCTRLTKIAEYGELGGCTMESEGPYAR